MKHRFQWRRAGWRGKRKQIANAALWIELDALLQARAPAAVVFSKVKAHATQADIQRGIISEYDLMGNKAADALAVAGACSWRGDLGHQRQGWLRASAAVSVQRMMVDILMIGGRRRSVGGAVLKRMTRIRMRIFGLIQGSLRFLQMVREATARVTATLQKFVLVMTLMLFP